MNMQRIGISKTLVRIAKKELIARIKNQKVPLFVQIMLTNRCNLRCKYCNVDRDNLRELSTAHILNTISQLADLGTSLISFAGGEPLLRNDIGEIVDFCKQKGIFVHISTNGIKLKEKFSQVKNTDLFTISLDGPEKAHDNYRGKGTFVKVLGAIDFVSRKKMRFSVSAVLAKHNIHSIDIFVRLAKEKNFKINFIIPEGDIRDVMVSNDEYRKAIRKILEYKRQGAPIASSYTYLKYILKWPDYQKTTSTSIYDDIKCFAAKRFFYITTDGYVYPCCLLTDIAKAKNLLEVGVKQAIDCAKVNDCKSCILACYLEKNIALSFRPLYLLETIKNIFSNFYNA